MAIRIDDYLSSYEAISSLSNQQETYEKNTSVTSDKDSFTTTSSDESEPVVCDTYNDILSKFAAARASSMTSSESSSSDSSTSDNRQNETGDGVSKASSGGGGSEEDESSVKTKTVIVDGVTYLETTTTDNGVEKVTRTVLDSTQGKDPQRMTATSSAASALTSM